MSLSEELAANGLWNPYDFANPVNDHLLFAGRERELKDINYYLRYAERAPRAINMVLSGPRSAGKTSLLNRIEHEATTRGFPAARIDLNEGDVDPFAFFFKIYDALLFSVVSYGAFAGFQGPTYRAYRAVMDGVEETQLATDLHFPAHYSNAHRNGLRLSEAIIKSDLRTIGDAVGRPCVLLFDECDVLAASRVELEMLRNVFMNTPGFMLVFSGTPNLFPAMEDVFSPIVRQFKKVPVEHFVKIRDTQQCIVKPLRSIGLEPSEVVKPSVVELAIDVHRLSAGRPYEIQLLCHFMFKRVEEGDANDLAITLDVLDDVRHELERQDSASGRQSVSGLHLLSREELRMLQALTEFEGTIEQCAIRSELFSEHVYRIETLTAAFERFERIGLMEMKDDGSIRFVGDQFDEVYARYYAAANEQSLTIWRSSFRDELEHSLGKLFDDFDDVRALDLDAVPGAETRRRIDEALLVLFGEGNQGERVSSLPDLSAEIYATVVRALDARVTTLIAIRLDILDISTERWFIAPGDATELIESNSAVGEPIAKAKEVGADGQTEIITRPVGKRSDLIQRVESLGAPNQLELFASAHASIGFEYYEFERYEDARREFEDAFRLHAEAYMANASAHLSLIFADYGNAEYFASRGRELSDSSEFAKFEWIPYLIATYDLAVARFMLGDVSTAKLLLSECLGCDEGPEVEGYFVVPGAANGQISLEVRNEYRLIDAAREFSAIMP